MSIWIVSVSSQALAFDDKRQGFLVGVGIGYHYMNEEYSDGDSSMGTSETNGIATSYRIGVGITDQFALYYISNASWYSVRTGSDKEIVNYAVSLSGIGASYYLSPDTPSIYLLVAAGDGELSSPFGSGPASGSGSAFMWGTGYEISEHLNIELTVLTADLDRKPGRGVKVKSESRQLTINYIWY